MFQVNENYLKLPGSYLFSTIGKKVKAYSEANPDKTIIRLGIGDVTQPLAPAIIEAMHKAVDEMGRAETFHGYAPDLGYEFLREAISEGDYRARGCDIAADEIFVSDGAKCDSGNIQEIFSTDNRITRTGDATLKRMKSLYQTERKATVAICRRCLPPTAASQSATRYIRSMWIPM